MASYKLNANGSITRTDVFANFRPVVGNKDYDDYLLWVAAGNTPTPADGPSAEDTALATAMTTRQTTLNKVTTNFPTSWTNFEGKIDQAIVYKIKANNAWTATDSRDACKLLIDIAMFCVAKLLVLIIERQDRR